MMGPRLRRMKPYHPRQKRRGSILNRQVLSDLKHKISAEVGSFLIFIEEGNKEQMVSAQQKAKSSLLKYGPEMQKIAEHMGPRLTTAVRDYLNSIDTIVHSSGTWVDQEKIRSCYLMNENLEKALSVA